MHVCSCHGHMLSYLELAKFLAQGSHKVSFVSTHRNIQRLPKPPPQLSLFVDFVKLALPRVEEIPANAEATMGVRSEDIHYLKKAYDGLAAELAQFLRSYCADWILHDFASHWLPPITAELGIPTAFLSIAAAWFPPSSAHHRCCLTVSRSRIPMAGPAGRNARQTRNSAWVNSPFPARQRRRKKRTWVSSASGWVATCRIGGLSGVGQRVTGAAGIGLVRLGKAAGGIGGADQEQGSSVAWLGSSAEDTRP
ncbi:unnamed protein product [Thlaspi arvense]|uniref:Uncharacterized protein n=1 Tax=Thlaspi arvense TaxID=13288 RepID=A0AAU9RFS7_THLAR|nr:unnamed protein product [Thlaspi arvense]